MTKDARAAGDQEIAKHCESQGDQQCNRNQLGPPNSHGNRIVTDTNKKSTSSRGCEFERTKNRKQPNRSGCPTISKRIVCAREKIDRSSVFRRQCEPDRCATGGERIEVCRCRSSQGPLYELRQRRHRASLCSRLGLRRNGLERTSAGVGRKNPGDHDRFARSWAK